MSSFFVFHLIFIQSQVILYSNYRLLVFSFQSTSFSEECAVWQPARVTCSYMGRTGDINVDIINYYSKNLEWYYNTNLPNWSNWEKVQLHETLHRLHRTMPSQAITMSLTIALFTLTLVSLAPVGRYYYELFILSTTRLTDIFLPSQCRFDSFVGPESNIT